MSPRPDCALAYAPGHLIQADLVQERILPRRLGRTVDVIDLLIRNLEPDKPIKALYLLYPNTLPDASFVSRKYLKNPTSTSTPGDLSDFARFRSQALHYPAGRRPWWPRRAGWRFAIIDSTVNLTTPGWLDNAIYHETFGANFTLTELPERPPQPKAWGLKGWMYIQPEFVDPSLAQFSELLKGSTDQPGIDLQNSRIYCGGEVRPYEQLVGIADDLSDRECELLRDTGFSLLKVVFMAGSEIGPTPRWLRLELWPTRCNYIRGDSGFWSSLSTLLTFQNTLIECTCVGGRGVKMDFRARLDIVRRHAEQMNDQGTIQVVQGLYRKIFEQGLLAANTAAEVKHCLISFERTWRVQLIDAVPSKNSLKLDLPAPQVGVPNPDTLARFLTGFAYYWRSHPVLLAQCIQLRLARYFRTPEQAKTTQEIAKELEVNTALCGALLQWMVEHEQLFKAGSDRFFWSGPMASFDALRGLYSVPFSDAYKELDDARPCSLDFRAQVKLHKSNSLMPIAVWLAVSVNLPRIMSWIWRQLGL